MVSGDLQGLQQILNNILSNAIKYTKAHGKISFLARREPSNERNRVHYTFVIKDTGCGMSAKFWRRFISRLNATAVLVCRALPAPVWA